MNNRLEGLQIIRWLDQKRWQSVDSSWEWARDLNADETILTHWLTYVTDRRMPASKVWYNQAPVFAEWVKEYSRQSRFAPSEHYSKRYGFDAPGVPSFKSRYHKEDFRAISRTLNVLTSYNKTLVCYVGELLQKYSEIRDVVSRIACGLYLLTYDVHYSTQQVPLILNNEFDGYFQRWQAHRTTNKKRLWAGFRDYKVGSEGRDLFTKALMNANYHQRIIDLFSKFGTEFRFLNKLELPGDVWNNNEIFIENYLKPLGAELGVEIPEKDIDAGTLNQKVREICKKAHDRGYDVYPEQFDVTFDFVPKMCANPGNTTARLCRELCPFGTGDPFFLMYHSESKYNVIVFDPHGTLANNLRESPLLGVNYVRGDITKYLERIYSEASGWPETNTLRLLVVLDETKEFRSRNLVSCMNALGKRGVGFILATQYSTSLPPEARNVGSYWILSSMTEVEMERFKEVTLHPSSKLITRLPRSASLLFSPYFYPEPIFVWHKRIELVGEKPSHPPVHGSGPSHKPEEEGGTE